MELLARNLFLNNLQEKVTIVPFALSDELGTNIMHMSTTEWGGALSTFGKDIGWDGGLISEVFTFKTFGLTLDQVVSILHFPYPDYIKMDVDGIEHFILQTGQWFFVRLKGILVEINDDFTEQAEQSIEALEHAGLTLLEKRHSEMFNDSKFKSSYNQIWIRK